MSTKRLVVVGNGMAGMACLGEILKYEPNFDVTVFKNTAFLVLTCDMPALDRAALRSLLDFHEPRRMLTIYSMPDGTEQPFPGVYEPALLSMLREKIKQEALSMKSIFKELPEKKVVLWGGEPEILRNINHPPLSGSVAFKSFQ